MAANTAPETNRKDAITEKISQYSRYSTQVTRLRMHTIRLIKNISTCGTTKNSSAFRYPVTNSSFRLTGSACIMLQLLAEYR